MAYGTHTLICILKGFIALHANLWETYRPAKVVEISLRTNGRSNSPIRWPSSCYINRDIFHLPQVYIHCISIIMYSFSKTP